MSLSHRNQSIDLLCKSIAWFLYDGNTGCKWNKWWFMGSMELFQMADIKFSLEKSLEKSSTKIFLFRKIRNRCFSRSQ